MYYVHTRTCILCTLYIIIMAIVFIHSQVLGKNNRLYDLGFLTRAEVLCAVNYGRRIYEPVEAGGGGDLLLLRGVASKTNKFLHHLFLEWIKR